MESWKAVDDLLTDRFGIGVEDALCHGCLTGHVEARLSGLVRIMPRLVRFEAEDDGGETSTYDGVLAIEEVWYRFRCQVFVDAGGLRFLSDSQKFEAVDWRVHLPMSKAG